MKKKHLPERMCIGCRTVKPKPHLLRIVRTRHQTLEIDETHTKTGRGAYLCFNEQCVKLALRKKAFSVHLKINHDDNLTTLLLKTVHVKSGSNQ